MGQSEDRGRTGQTALAGEDSSRVTHLPGIIAALGDFGPGAVIMEQGLCVLFGRHESSVKRAVERGELPQPVRLFGQKAWTAGVLVKHLETRLEQAAQEAGQKAQDIRRKMLELSS
jgi:hypothetical protein